MPISDKKKCQTLINLAAEAAEHVQVVAARLKTVRSAYQAQAVDPTGTPLDGHLAAVSTWIDNIDSVANSGVVTEMIAAKVPTHRNKALES